MNYGPEDLQAEFGLADTVMARLAAYDATLLDWSARHNLIARSTLDERWDRHYRDSAQLFSLIPAGARSLADLGSGAGFPGLVLAAMGEAKGLGVSLIESTGKKAAFLSAAAAAMALKNLRVIPQRIESLTLPAPDVITARALAQLDKLLAYAHGISTEKTMLILPKGQDVEAELTAAAKSWHISVEKKPSVTSDGSTILVIRNARPKRPALPARR